MRNLAEIGGIHCSCVGTELGDRKKAISIFPEPVQDVLKGRLPHELPLQERVVFDSKMFGIPPDTSIPLDGLAAQEETPVFSSKTPGKQLYTAMVSSGGA